MGFKINIHGIEIVATTAAEALALAREAATVKRGPGRPPNPNADKAHEKNSGTKLEDALKVLTVIQNAGSDGATSKAIGKALNVSDPRGIGAGIRPINKLLDDLGIARASVYGKERIPKVGRFWKAKAHMPEAIEAIKRKLNNR